MLLYENCTYSNGGVDLLNVWLFNKDVFRLVAEISDLAFFDIFTASQLLDLFV